MSVWVCEHVCRFLQRPEEGMGSSGAGVTVSCGLSDVDAWNRTQGLWKEKEVLFTTKPSLQPESVYFDSQFKVQSIKMGSSRQQELEAATHITPTVRKHSIEVTHASKCLAQSPHLYSL